MAAQRQIPSLVLNSKLMECCCEILGRMYNQFPSEYLFSEHFIMDTQFELFSQSKVSHTTLCLN